MKYLLDVNAIVAFGHTEHEFHARVATWAAKMAQKDVPQFFTSPITELGFVRIMSQAYGASVNQAQALLLKLKESEQFVFSFLVDDRDASKLPPWVVHAKHTTDGHLLELAKANGCQLATFDTNIPDAFVIP